MRNAPCPLLSTLLLEKKVLHQYNLSSVVKFSPYLLLARAFPMVGGMRPAHSLHENTIVSDEFAAIVNDEFAVF